MSNPAIQYCCIGRGFCGSVWALENSQSTALTAIKREDGGPGRSITNDHTMQVRVLESLNQHHIPISVPQSYALIEPTDAWWADQLPRFPQGYSACRALISERIPMVPRRVSDKLVDLFCKGNKPLADFVKGNLDDESCLVRPYLGRRRRHRQGGATNSRFQRFSLRNVPLHVDQMEILGLDIKLYAETMADALALMHWGAGIDANDVEFVLAPPRKSASASTTTETFESDYLGAHCMWILDFDCCREMAMDDVGVEQACKAFFKNDPFYPRPGRQLAADRELWGAFKQQFIKTSQVILDQDMWWIAEKLIQRIEDVGAQGQAHFS